MLAKNPRNASTAFGLALLIAFSSFASLAIAAGPGSGPGGQEQARTQAMTCAGEANMFAQVSFAEGKFTGKYLSFELSDGKILNYTVGESKVKVFESVEVIGFGYSGACANGAVAQINGTDAKILAHNNPPAILHISKASSAASQMNIVLASGISAEKLGNGSNIRLTGGIDAVILVGSSNATILGSAITITFTQQSCAITVRCKPALPESYREQLQKFAREGKMGGEIDVVANGGEHVEDGQGYEHHTAVAVNGAEKGKVRIRISAEYSEGKIFRIGLDSGTAGTTDAKKLQAKLDGEKMKRVSLDELGQYQEQKRTEAAYCIESNGAGCDVLAYVPHFSEHELTIDKISETANSGLPGFEAVVLIAAIGVAAMLFALRRRA